MSLKKVLLARPNVFIVKEMKNFITEANYEPIPIANVSELDNYNPSEIGGIVISTAITSTVNEDYQDLVKIVKDKFPNTTVLLATLIDYDKISSIVKSRFKNINLDYNVLTIKEASEKKRIDNRREIVAIQKSDLTDNYQLSLNTVRNLFS
jgi:hypothetical protein